LWCLGRRAGRIGGGSDVPAGDEGDTTDALGPDPSDALTMDDDALEVH